MKHKKLSIMHLAFPDYL